MPVAPRKSVKFPVVFAFTLSCCSSTAFAVNWFVYSGMKVREIYSDNVRLAPKGSEKSALVTEVSPNLAVTGRTGRRTNFNLNYQMQNLYNAGRNNGITISNQLQHNSYNVLAQNRLYLTSRSSISQQNISTDQIAVDNISGSGNSTTVRTFGISPTWTPTIGHYANGSATLNFQTVNTGLKNNDETNNLLSDTVTFGENIQLNSGTRFGRYNWGLSFNNSESRRKSGDNVAFQTASGIIRPYLNRYFSLFAQAGYSNNNFRSNTDSNRNGVFYTFGGTWSPSRHYSFEAGYGNNKYVTVFISPITRFNWTTTFRDNSIGLNSGKTWQTALNYWTVRSNWTLTHTNDTVTTQEILSNLQVFAPNTGIIGNASPAVNPFAINIPSLTDEVIVRRRWNFSLSYFSGKTHLSATAYNEHRSFQVSGSNERVRGISGSWSWRFAAKTSFYLNPTWQQTERSGNNTTPSSSDQRYDIAIGVNQAISQKLNGNIEFRHITQNSNLMTNDYQENRATATLFMRF